MSRTWILIVLLSLTPLACGDDDAATGNTNDAGAALDGDVELDAAQPVPCTATGDPCGAGLECLCCGSIGPAAICVCTMACDTSADCTDPALPHCNQPGAGSPGICTTPDYNCCWECQ